MPGPMPLGQGAGPRVKLAFARAPREAAEIMAKITTADKKVNELTVELSEAAERTIN